MARLTHRIVIILILGVMLLPLESPLIQAAFAEEHLTSGEFVKCVDAPTVELPPFEMAPKPVGSKGQSEGTSMLEPDTFKPVCPDGQVPLPKESYGPKGNPLLGGKNYAQTARGSRFETGNQGRRGSNRSYGDMPACDGVAWFGSCFYYASAIYSRQADGGGMTTAVYRPDYVRLTAAGGHSLNEIAIQGGADDGNIVELGWNVSTDQYGDADPHLFVFHWISWRGTCYDGCGWVQYSRTYFPGMNLSAIIGRPVYIGYVYYEGNWWAWFDNQWLGYFPGTEWSGTFTTSTMIQWFGEVASQNGIPPRTDMGNGLFSSAPAAAVMSTLCDVDAGDWVCWYRNEHSLIITQPRYYDIDRTGFGEVRYGGPGE